jgi:hypothetical protein
MARSNLLSLLVAVPALLASVAEPTARPAVAVRLTSSPRVTHVSAAAELADGRVVLSDAKTPALWLLDPATGEVTVLGSPGAGPEQWVRPGGFYGGNDGYLRLLDRAQARVMLIGPDARFGTTYSIAERGTIMASDADVDLQQLDAAGHSYFPDLQGALIRARGQKVSSVPLIRFDPLTQQRTPVTDLVLADSRSSTTGDGMTLTRTVWGSPADGWGVAPDGRIAVVHGEPYRVDWIASDGRVVHGPDIPYDKLPVTETDRQSVRAVQAKGPSAGVSQSGGASGGPTLEPIFAATKAPFRPEDVLVSADAQVWVLRSGAAASRVVTYDVFGAGGLRIDRVQLPDGSRVVGFGRGVVYVRGLAAGRETLARYRRK